ncbi:hypothetical protein IW140_002915 [Coemansia sp. RSA 1813]|nr:hypothetical protein LPJ74_001871 [Coemansia sp. RSA 1843]KAJ2089752.1 hypothetical protein IW138_003208 [Coemansia sp. RSA 986]KAJ2214244.1 hypothetical protein EV179_003146 [Coemansia sp. RSA 487]KAJ2569661.1 hypothetical protein IW140_002915 [Coemansia sp. RSA 1813]
MPDKKTEQKVIPNSQDISGDAAQDVLSQLVDGKVAEIQGMLKTLADKAEAVEQDINEEGRDDKVADAYKDIVRAEKAVGSLETRLDALLGRLDGLLEHQMAHQSSDKPSSDPAR